MAVFYVDYTTGDDDDSGLTEALAWKTIAKVNASSFNGDDFILFKCGETWNEELHIPSAGTLGHPITFGSYGTGAKPIIDGTGLDYCVHESVGKGYITLDGLEFADPDILGVFHGYYPVGIEGSTPNWIVQNCTLTHCACQLHGPNTIVQDCTFHGPQPTSQGNNGALIIRGAVATNCSVLRNTVEGFYARGIWFLSNADTPTVNDNIVYNIDYSYGTSGEGYGINFDGYGKIITGIVTALRNTVYNCDQYGFMLENCSDGSVIEKNLIHDCTSSGIAYLNYAASGNYSEQRGNDVDGLIAYNVIYKVNRGVKLESVKGVDIWNNVIAEGTGTTPAAIGVAGTGHTYIGSYDIRNNVFGADFAYIANLPDAWANSFSAFDYNRVKTGTVIHERTPATDYTLAQLQALNQAINCFTTDPAFVDEGGHDYHLLSSSPCINAGADVGLTEDFEGNDIW